MTLTAFLSTYLEKNSSASTGGFFITGTDTNIGKTFMTCLIAKNLQKRPGLAVFVRKPIASGCIKQSDGYLLSEDAHALYLASQCQEPMEIICPYRFEAVASPAHAIRQSTSGLTLSNLISACQVPNKGFRLVEGAGGFYSPITPDALNADLAMALQLPIILVVGNQLGCINHCLLSLAAIEQTKLSIAAVIVNDLSPEANPQNFYDIQTLTDYPVIHHPFKP